MTDMEGQIVRDNSFCLTTATQRPSTLTFLANILKQRKVSSSYNSETVELNVTV